MPPKYPRHGRLNDLSPSPVEERFDLKSPSASNFFETIIDKIYTPNILSSVGPMKGIVLRVESDTSHTPGGWVTGFFDNVFGDDQNPQLVQVKVRVPELHSMIPIPESLGKDSTQPSIIEMYPTFVARDEDVAIPDVGSVVWVDFVDKVNFKDPIYIGPVLTRESYPSESGTAKPKGKYFNACLQTFSSKAPAGDPIPAKPKPISHSGPPLKKRRPAPGEESLFLKGKRASPVSTSRWEKALTAKSLSGTTWIGNINSNGAEDPFHDQGKRDTLLFSPSSTSLSSPLEIIYYFHGIDEFGAADLRDKVAAGIKSLAAKGRNFVFAMPELPWSNMTERPNRRFNIATAWRPVDNFSSFHKDVLTQMREAFSNGIEIKHITIIGHGGGGKAISNAVRHFDAISPDRIIFSEASLADYLDVVWDKYASKRPDVEIDILVQSAGASEKNARDFINRISANLRDNVRLESLKNKNITQIGAESFTYENPLLKELRQRDEDINLMETKKNPPQDIDAEESSSVEPSSPSLPSSPLPLAPPPLNADVSPVSSAKTSPGTRKVNDFTIKPSSPFQEARVTVSDYDSLQRDNQLLVGVPSTPGSQQRLHVLAAKRFSIMNQAWLQENPGQPPILITSGWRRHRWESREQYEEKMIKEYGSVKNGQKYLAYNSPHETGLAFDIGNLGLTPSRKSNDQQKKTKIYLWLKENAHKYGISPYKVEAWHWEVRLPRESWASGQEFTDNLAVVVVNPGTSGDLPKSTPLAENCIGNLGNIISTGNNFFIDDTNITSGNSKGMLTGEEKKLLIEQLSAQISIEPEVAYAFFQVESGGKPGFCANGRPLIRFEPHVFSEPKRMEKFGVSPSQVPWAGGNSRERREKWKRLGFQHGSTCGTNNKEYQALQYAIKINEQLAFASTSVGSAQILGFNYSLVGAKNPKDMFEQMANSEEYQIKAFFRFVQKRSGLLEALRKRDFTMAATLYNGAGREEIYAPRLASNYQAYKSRGIPT